MNEEKEMIYKERKGVCKGERNTGKDVEKKDTEMEKRKQREKERGNSGKQEKGP